MSVKRQTYSAEFKSKVALEAIKEERTINEIASSYSIHPQLVKQWKKLAQDNIAVVFTDKRSKMSKEKDDEALKEQLYQQIGQLKVELDWLKKKTGHLG
jgi:transposase-like protein